LKAERVRLVLQLAAAALADKGPLPGAELPCPGDSGPAEPGRGAATGSPSLVAPGQGVGRGSELRVRLIHGGAVIGGEAGLLKDEAGGTGHTRKPWAAWFTVRPRGGTDLGRGDDSGDGPGRRDGGIMQTREERRGELKRLAATPNGLNKLYAILTRNFIPFEKLPIGTLMIEAILDHEYPGERAT
jgi:hypothetical protein